MLGRSGPLTAYPAIKLVIGHIEEGFERVQFGGAQAAQIIVGIRAQYEVELTHAAVPRLEPQALFANLKHFFNRLIKAHTLTFDSGLL